MDNSLGCNLKKQICQTIKTISWYVRMEKATLEMVSERFGTLIKQLVEMIKRERPYLLSSLQHRFSELFNKSVNFEYKKDKIVLEFN